MRCKQRQHYTQSQTRRRRRNYHLDTFKYLKEELLTSRVGRILRTLRYLHRTMPVITTKPPTAETNISAAFASEEPAVDIAFP